MADDRVAFMTQSGCGDMIDIFGITFVFEIYSNTLPLNNGSQGTQKEGRNGPRENHP